MTRLLTLLAFMTVFVGGYDLVLPGVGFGVRIALAYGIFLGNVLLLLYLLLFACAGGLSRLGPVLAERRALTYVLLVVALGLLGIVSAGINQTSTLDFGQAARLVLYGIYFLLIVYWSRTRRTFALRAYLLGIGVGGAVNLYYTVLDPPLVVFGVLPVLHSSNGAGGLLATAVGLGAWLWMLRESRWDARVAVAVSAVGLVAVALSFSKTAMLIGFLGVCGWLSVVALKSARRFAVRALVLGAAGLGVIVFTRPYGIDPWAVRDVLVRAVAVKFGNMTLESRFGIDAYNVTGSRYAYWPMTFHVLAEHPIAGVGYSGLYDAYAEARKGYEDLALAEVQESRATNPHNSFLYYVGANGLFGLVLVTWIFVKSLRVLLRACARHGLPGRLLWLSLASAYLVYGFTLPTLFNTEVLYLPAAVAVAHGRRWSGALQRLVARRRGSVAGADSIALEPRLPTAVHS
jgi:O-antigen ligase